MYALDRILGVVEDSSEDTAAREAGAAKQQKKRKGGEDETKTKEEGEEDKEKGEEEEEDIDEMPLVCDVCGKTPDVEVSVRTEWGLGSRETTEGPRH